MRLQWDPDHNPLGHPVERRAIQLGLRGQALWLYGNEALLSVEDITPFVVEQRKHRQVPFTDLVVPAESVYPVDGVACSPSLGIDEIPGRK